MEGVHITICRSCNRKFYWDYEYLEHTKDCEILIPIRADEED